MCKVAPVYYFIFKHKLPPTETLVERECCFYAADLRRRQKLVAVVSGRVHTFMLLLSP